MMHNYTREQENWIINKCGGIHYSELAELFNKTFGTQVTGSAMKCKCHKLGLVSGFQYTEKQLDWLKENAGKYSRKELTELFNQTFNENRTEQAIKRVCVKHGFLASSTGRFQKGNKPWTANISREEYLTHFSDDSRQKQLDCLEKGRRKYKLGDTVIRKIDGIPYAYILIDEGGRSAWRRRLYPKGRYVWEQHNGKMPENSVIIFLDGNQLNCNIENLMCIHNQDKIQFTTNGWWQSDKEVKIAGVKFCELTRILRESDGE